MFPARPSERAPGSAHPAPPRPGLLPRGCARAPGTAGRRATGGRSGARGAGRLSRGEGRRPRASGGRDPTGGGGAEGGRQPASERASEASSARDSPARSACIPGAALLFPPEVAAPPTSPAAALTLAGSAAREARRGRAGAEGAGREWGRGRYLGRLPPPPSLLLTPPGLGRGARARCLPGSETRPAGKKAALEPAG